jgi:PAS domain S-box-containing protein
MTIRPASWPGAGAAGSSVAISAPGAPPDAGAGFTVALPAASGTLATGGVAAQGAVADAAWGARSGWLFMLLPDPCFLTDPEGVIREANPAAGALLRLARTYLLGKPLAAYVAEEDLPSLHKALARVGALAEGKTLNWEGRLRPRRTTERVQAQARIVPLRGEDGATGGLCWLLRDVTAERRLAERYQALVAEQDARLLTRTMELEAIVRMQAAQIAHGQAATR